ncbi:MAG: FAD-binding oxidoreductase [Planctomycetota bacterium]|jgi:FAD/FMN-containing dehydrogenase
MARVGTDPRSSSVLVNDVHSRLSSTRVAGVRRPRTRQELRMIVRRASASGQSLAVSGGRNSMGGQPFATDRWLIDMRGLDRVLAFDEVRGLITVEGGIDWPALIAATRSRPGDWAIAQKQTGADRFTIGGSLACNGHGRGLDLPPLGAQVESMRVVDPRGESRFCDRTEQPDLFALAIGGYGLFGLIESVTLRLVPRIRLRRRVEIRASDGLMDAFADRRAAGCRYGDFQFAIDPASDDFLRRGVFSCYEPTDDPLTEDGLSLGEAGFRRLLLLAHTDKRAAFERYAEHYLATDGRVYESDTHQLTPYPAGYHDDVDACLGRCGSEMITELSVPRGRFDEFMAATRDALRTTGADPIYGTVRVIERDEDSFLAWAREPWACIVLNLHVDHTRAGVAAARRQFRALNECALACGGTFYLPYHRWSSADQLRRAHPRLVAFFARKQLWDPDRRFTSDWYEATRRVLS